MVMQMQRITTLNYGMINLQLNMKHQFKERSFGICSQQVVNLQVTKINQKLEQDTVNLWQSGNQEIINGYVIYSMKLFKTSSLINSVDLFIQYNTTQTIQHLIRVEAYLCACFTPN
ncbi:unnamed protein product [Paramecium pentaurelia]|uniref:Uncharacterized protein n=1 Tax=Paramecium pentaurelia TaxID=43138 RepID=A0A8S1Y8L0_9CILI|nr:unnamed protein product [Paramecium pentaurelia]